MANTIASELRIAFLFFVFSVKYNKKASVKGAFMMMESPFINVTIPIGRATYLFMIHADIKNKRFAAAND